MSVEEAFYTEYMHQVGNKKEENTWAQQNW